MSAPNLSFPRSPRYGNSHPFPDHTWWSLRSSLIFLRFLVSLGWWPWPVRSCRTYSFPMVVVYLCISRTLDVYETCSPMLHLPVGPLGNILQIIVRVDWEAYSEIKCWASWMGCSVLAMVIRWFIALGSCACNAEQRFERPRDHCAKA